MNIILKFLFASFVVGFLTSVNECSAQFLSLSGADISLTIRAPLAAGLDPRSDTDASSRLTWFFAPRGRTKIVVSTVAPSQDFRLFVQAINVLGGDARPEIQLLNGMSPRDFVRNVTSYWWILGRTDVSYRAEAPAILGNSNSKGNDQHTVVYTWVAQ